MNRLIRYRLNFELVEAGKRQIHLLIAIDLVAFQTPSQRVLYWAIKDIATLAATPARNATMWLEAVRWHDIGIACLNSPNLAVIAGDFGGI